MRHGSGVWRLFGEVDKDGAYKAGHVGFVTGFVEVGIIK